MIQASHPSTLWFPGKKLDGFGAAHLSARAQEIAKSREELLSLLHDLPESEYELSLTDLVEQSDSDVDGAASQTVGDASAGKNTKRCATVGKKEKKKLTKSSSSGFSLNRSNGVLLNMYMPSSFRACQETMTDSKVAVNCSNKRQKEHVMLGCFSGLWEMRPEKSKKKMAQNKRRESQHHSF